MAADGCPRKLSKREVQTLQREVFGGIQNAMETDGLEQARGFFEQMNKHYSDRDWWPAVARRANELFVQAKQAEQQKAAEREQLAAEQAMRLAELQRTQVQIRNNAIHRDMNSYRVDQLNGIVENGAQAIHTLHEDEK